MRDIEHVFITDERKAHSRKGYRLVNVGDVDIADALKACLHYFFKSSRTARYAIYVFVIEHLIFSRVGIRRILYNRECDVGLQCEQLARRIVKGDDPIAYKEILIGNLEIVLLKFAHLKRKISKATVK